MIRSQKNMLELIPLLFLSPAYCPCQAGKLEDPSTSARSGPHSIQLKSIH